MTLGLSSEEARAGPAESVPGTEINFLQLSKKHHFLTGENGVFYLLSQPLLYGNNNQKNNQIINNSSKKIMYSISYSLQYWLMDVIIKSNES